MPLIAIGEELAANQAPFIYVGGKNSREENIAKGLGWNFVGIDSGKWRRDNSFAGLSRNIADLINVAKGFFQSLRVLSKSGAEVIFSKGGHVALPMVLAARFRGKKIIIHESDSVMGATNRFSAKFAKKILTAFSTDTFDFADDRFLQVGVPVRKYLRQAASLKAPAKSRPVIMILGGIQGALSINNYIRQILPELLKHYDVVHSVGDQNLEAAKNTLTKLPKEDQPHYRLFGTIDRELPYYYQTADLIIARASATVIAEAAIFSKAMYLIPLPNGAGNHQVTNAKLLQKVGAVMFKEQYQLSSEVLLEDINLLMKDSTKRLELGTKLYQYFDNSKTLERIIETLNGKE